MCSAAGVHFGPFRASSAPTRTIPPHTRFLYTHALTNVSATPIELGLSIAGWQLGLSVTGSFLELARFGFLFAIPLSGMPKVISSHSVTTISQQQGFNNNSSNRASQLPHHPAKVLNIIRG